MSAQTDPEVSSSRVGVIVASLSRPDNLEALLASLAEQTQIPAVVVLSIEKPADAPPLANPPFEVQVIEGPRGLTLQRNRGLDALRGKVDYVLFVDDDYVPSRYAIAGIAAFFDTHAEIAGISGRLIKDGINGPGIDRDTARAMVAEDDLNGPVAPAEFTVSKPHGGLYGCNMAYRCSMIEDAAFDPALPLYGWQEDIDFGGQIKNPLVYTNAFSGVHCGEKSGREVAGRRLGYSQMVNPYYLIRKGTMEGKAAILLMMRNFASNHAKMLAPEPWIDRKSRAAGNWIALWDMLRGKADPMRTLDL